MGHLLLSALTIVTVLSLFIFTVLKKDHRWKVVVSYGAVLFLLTNSINPKFQSLFIEFMGLKTELSQIKKNIKEEEKKLISILKEINYFNANKNMVLALGNKKNISFEKEIFKKNHIPLTGGRYAVKLPLKPSKSFPFDKIHAGSWIFFDPGNQSIYQIDHKYNKTKSGDTSNLKEINNFKYGAARLSDTQKYFLMEMIGKEAKNKNE